MSKKPKNWKLVAGLCQRGGCKRAAVARRLCVKHYRFTSMRQVAHRTKKRAPSFSEMDKLVPSGMICPPCGRRMNWAKKEGAGTVITLQHDRSGRLKMICMSCNSRHARFKGDTFYKIQPDERKCSLCGKLKHFTEFPRSRGGSRWKGRTSPCLPCHRKKNERWRKENREKHLESQRASQRRFRQRQAMVS